MSKFGWDYPAGAANDPNAPYNQPDDDFSEDILQLEEALHLALGQAGLEGAAEILDANEDGPEVNFIRPGLRSISQDVDWASFDDEGVPDYVATAEKISALARKIRNI